MELLIIKSGHDYIRRKDGCFVRCGLDKASVFPRDAGPLVRRYAGELRRRGFGDVCICRLILTEEPVSEEDLWCGATGAVKEGKI